MFEPRKHTGKNKAQCVFIYAIEFAEKKSEGVGKMLGALLLC